MCVHVFVFKLVMCMSVSVYINIYTCVHICVYAGVYRHTIEMTPPPMPKAHPASKPMAQRRLGGPWDQPLTSISGNFVKEDRNSSITVVLVLMYAAYGAIASITWTRIHVYNRLPPTMNEWDEGGTPCSKLCTYLATLSTSPLALAESANADGQLLNLEGVVA